MSTPLFSDTVSGLGGQLQLELSILSRKGGRNYNEDACGHWHAGGHLCCVVADGANGHGGGDIASKLAVQQLIGSYAQQPTADPVGVRNLIVETNRTIIEHRALAEGQRHMHTTVVSLFLDLDSQTALWGHAGDSRLYIFRNGRVLSHTRDHSLVQSLVDAGLLAPEKMRTHPQRSELLSALGTAEEDLQVSVAEQPWLFQTGDVFLLCTDGLWEYVDDAELAASLRDAPDPQTWLAELEATVLRNAAHKPSHDNFSAVTVWVVDPI